MWRESPGDSVERRNSAEKMQDLNYENRLPLLGSNLLFSSHLNKPKFHLSALHKIPCVLLNEKKDWIHKRNGLVAVTFTLVWSKEEHQ